MDILLYVPILSFIFGFIVGCIRRQINENEKENGGEAKVRQSLAKYCENRDAHLLNNITLRLIDGSTTQVDHILVTTKGIFVIETKHYNGWIFADSDSRVWTQIFYRLKFRFQSPTFQNYKHVKAVQNLFSFLEPKYIYNIVVFTGAAEFKTPKPDNVFYIKELIPVIEQYSEDVLSLNRVQFCVGRLEYFRLELTRETDIEHQEYFKQKFTAYENKGHPINFKAIPTFKEKSTLKSLLKLKRKISKYC